MIKDEDLVQFAIVMTKDDLIKLQEGSLEYKKHRQINKSFKISLAAGMLDVEQNNKIKGSYVTFCCVPGYEGEEK